MVWGVTAITFLATVAILVALVYAFTPAGTNIAARLSRLMNPAIAVPEAGFSHKQKERVRDTLAMVGKMVPGDSVQAPRAQLMLMRAGYRSSQAVMAMRGFKVLAPL